MNVLPGVLFATDKPVAAVRIEGTLADSDTLDPLGDSLDLLSTLGESHFVVLVSPRCHTDAGLVAVMDFVIRTGCYYDLVWSQPGIPPADVWYDNEATTL